MTPDHHRRAVQLFEQFRELPEDERTAAIDAACAGDPELRARTVSLIEADREAANGSFLGRRAIEDAARLLDAHPCDLPSPGAVIGHYRLRARIGAEAWASCMKLRICVCRVAWRSRSFRRRPRRKLRKPSGAPA